jgi:ketosteroid isomerase-like protein
MSEENVESFKRANEAWMADDLDAWLAELDPEAEWHTALEQAVEGSGVIFQSHDGLREAWEEYRYKKFGTLMDRVQDVRDLGESVLVLGHLDLSGRTAGVQFSQEFAQLVTFRDGKILRTDDFLSHADALEAAGVSE